MVKLGVSDCSETGFYVAIFRCVDRALSKLGETPKQALYYQIASKRGMNRGQLQTRPEEVLEGLRGLLGETGYCFIKKETIAEIKTSFALTNGLGDCLSKVIEEAKKKFLNS